MFKRFWWVFLVMAPVGMFSCFLMAAVITYVMPKKYESETVIEVRPRTVLGIQSSAVRTTPQFFATEFEVIKSRHLFEKVVVNLELVKRWNVDTETALRILKGIVTTQNIRGTDLILIRVRHTNKQDAKDVAEEVAKSYKDTRGEIDQRDTEAALKEIRKVVKEQEDKVEDRRKIIAENAHLKRLGESDNQALIEAKKDLESDQAQLQQMKLKLMAETIALKTPSESVAIHDLPVLSESPVSPNVTLNLILGAVLGLLFSPLLALPVAWGLNRRS